MYVNLALCLFTSYQLHWSDVISTHCKNWQFFPSMSSVIGNNTPERYIWRIGNCLQIIIQYIWIVPLARHYYRLGTNLLLIFVFSASYFVQVSGLMILTYVSSTENHSIHEMGFIMYVLGQTIEMASNVLIDYTTNPPQGGGLSPTGYRAKYACMILNMMCGVVIALSYYYHITFCTPGAFSCFALGEWMFVITHITYAFFKNITLKGTGNGLYIVETPALVTKSVKRS